MANSLKIILKTNLKLKYLMDKNDWLIASENDWMSNEGKTN